jgi:hypothetical protein
MKTKDRIFAILSKPDRSHWKAFSFDSKSNQSDIEAFMVSIHVYSPNYFLIMRSDLTAKKPCKGSSNATTIYYYKDRFVLETPVSCSFERRKENGVIVKNRCFKVR